MYRTLATLILFGAYGPPSHGPSRPRAPRKRPQFQRQADADPRINRWTGKPHEHQREIARRLRQKGNA